MSTRENAHERASRSLSYPRVIVEALDDDEVAVSFVVPHSKFGSVSVKMTSADAAVMCAEIVAAAGVYPQEPESDTE